MAAPVGLAVKFRKKTEKQEIRGRTTHIAT